MFTAVEADQPGGCEAGAPFALQQDLEFFVGDRVGGSTQGLKKGGALALVFSRVVGVDEVQVAPGSLRFAPTRESGRSRAGFGEIRDRPSTVRP